MNENKNGTKMREQCGTQKLFLLVLNISTLYWFMLVSRKGDKKIKC